MATNQTSGGEVVLFQADDGETRLEVQLVKETVWLSLKNMVDLFGRDKSVVSRHLSNIFREGELERQAVVAKFATTAVDGKPSVCQCHSLSSRWL